MDILSTVPSSVTHVSLDLGIVPQFGMKEITRGDVLRQLDWASFGDTLRRIPALEVVELSARHGISWTEETEDAVQNSAACSIQRILRLS